MNNFPLLYLAEVKNIMPQITQLNNYDMIVLMKSSSQISSKKRILRYLPLSFVAIAILLAISWPVVSKYIPNLFPEPTYPLEDKLEYVGKSDYGCNFGCDANPASIYYYATDMNVQEVIKYFGRATPIISQDFPDGTYQSLTYTEINLGIDQSRFSIKYYNDSYSTIESNHLKHSQKQFILSLSNSHYQLAKDSL